MRDTRIAAFAKWLRPRLEDEDVDGKPLPVAGRAALRVQEADGRVVVALGRSGSLELCVTTRRNTVVAYSLSTRTALTLAWFILWRWWALGLWCGAKERLWTWAVYRTKIAPPPHALPTPHVPPRHLAP